jgi:hypothetical protein
VAPRAPSTGLVAAATAAGAVLLWANRRLLCRNDLTNMRARLDALGGSVGVRSRPGAGTRVEGRIPVHEVGP